MAVVQVILSYAKALHPKEFKIAILSCRRSDSLSVLQPIESNGCGLLD